MSAGGRGSDGDGAGATVLGGRYELGPSIGTGGMAEVFAGTDTRLGREVAVKVLRADLARDPSFQDRFRREAQAAASLNAPCIVSVFDTGDGDDGVPWIVMERVRGRTLRQVLIDEGRLQPQRALEVTADVCAALQVAHEAGIVHRDVKPGNVMLTRSGEVKVMDFGIARAAAGGGQTMTQTAAVLGTAAYLSPEQARGEQVDARSDVYSTGCLLYELVTGTPPFTGDSPIAVAYQHVREDPVPPSGHDTSLPPAVDAVVLKAMAKNPANRYQSADEMRDDLLRAASGGPVQATPLLVQDTTVVPAGSERWDPSPPPRRGPVYAAFALVLLLVIVGVAFLVRSALDDGARLVRTPSVVGLEQEAAARRLAALDLQVGDVELVFDERPVGEVVAQSPLAGVELEEFGEVDLVVSQGVEQVAVPDLVGQSEAAATIALEAAGLTLGDVIASDVNVTPGEVLEVTPAAGTTVPTGTVVSLTVASGEIEVPLVVGQLQQEASEALQRAGFDVAVDLRDDPGTPGRVLEQDPVNTQAGRGSVVTIVVSQAPPPPPPPSPTPAPAPTPTVAPTPTPTATVPVVPTPTPTAAPTA